MNNNEQEKIEVFLGIYTAIANLTVKILDLEKEIKELEENQKNAGMYRVKSNEEVIKELEADK